MLCAYCNEDKKLTREHVIPKGIIELFPECNMVISEKRYYIGEHVIKDVCETCNNENLSNLDGYGREFISKYFLNDYKPDIQLSVTYDYYLLSRWLLKIGYNLYRSDNMDVSWYKSNLRYILGESYTTTQKFSLFGGLCINVSPLPDFWVNNKQMNIVPNPVFILGGIEEMRNIVQNNLGRESIDLDLKGLNQKFIIRIGTGIFLLLLWEKEAVMEDIIKYELLIETLFPYKLLKNDKSEVNIKRCTDAFNYHTLSLIFGEGAMNLSITMNVLCHKNLHITASMFTAVVLTYKNMLRS